MDAKRTLEGKRGASNSPETARFTISTHENGYYCVSIPKYKGSEVVTAEARDALARVTLEWIEKFKDLDHRILHPADAQVFTIAARGHAEKATRLVCSTA